MHGLVAAYAVDALSPEETRKFERHLRTCASCRAELDGLQEAAAALAFAAPPQELPSLVRPRILAEARADRPRRVGASDRRLRFAPSVYVAGAATLAAAAAAVWAISLSHELGQTRTTRDAAVGVTAVLAQRDVHFVPLKDANGSLAVAPNGQAAILVSDLPPAGKGKTYQVWVINGDEPQPAGLLPSGAGRAKLALKRLVLPGTRVAVSIEPAGGVEHITGPELFSAINT